MITGFIINAFYVLLYNILNVFPVGNGLPPEINDSILTMTGYLKAFSFILPVNDILLILVTVVTVEVSIFGVKIVNWVIKKIRGSN